MPLADPGTALPNLSEQVRRLERAWTREHPRRAAGALNALSGFRYQFLVVLLETVRQWIAFPRPDKARIGVFTERLSDLLHIEKERAVTITQIKKTASPSEVRSALEELWLIHGLALQEVPDLAGKMRYRILASRGTLAVIERERAKWAPEGVPAASLAEFKSRVTAALETDPEDELLALLVNDLRASDPLARVYGWLGKLQDAAEHGFEAAARAIWDDLVGLAAADTKPAGVYVWTAADRPPHEVERGQFLSGFQPQVRHLREGYFAPRHEAYDDLTAHAERWAASDPTAVDQALRVPVFWIQGRSGSGKSVALLHLLARLHDQGQGPILWLADKIQALPPTMRWARHLQRKGRRVLIALDDPFAPGEQTESAGIWREALTVMQDAREGGRPEEVPLIFCCGPTEQADNLEAELSQDLLIERHELPRERREEIAGLRQWFLRRTGQSAPEIGDDENVLLVQLFFEWRVKRKLPAFADHFRRRLREADSTGAILGFVTRLLALNRIYVGYPPAAAKDALQGKRHDALNRLRRDEHIAEDREGRSGMWLAHPHLSNAIYEHWHPAAEANREERKTHLREAIGDCLSHGGSPRERMAPLWALARALQGTGRGETLAERLEAELVTELLAEVYAQLLSPGILTLAELPVWIELRGLRPDLALDPDPVLQAVSAVGAADLEKTGLRLTCHKLLQHLRRFPEPLRAQAADAIVQLLMAALPLGWHEWQPVAMDAVVRLRDSRLWPLVVIWAQAHPRLPGTARLLIRAVALSDGEPELLRAAYSLLQDAPADLAWGDLAILLLEKETGGPPPSVEQWVRRHHRDFSACFVLRYLLERGFPSAESWALQWASLWHRERSANFVLEALCRRGVALPELCDWCQGWIILGHADGSYLIEQLIRLFPRDEHIHQLANRWLQTAPLEHGSWAFIWGALFKATPKDPELTLRAMYWLQHSPLKHGSWAFIWTALHNADPGDPELDQLARQWLQKTPPEHGSWLFVWQPLWDTVPGDPELDQLARQWLQKAPPGHGSWQFVWQPLWDASPGDPELNQLARQWLQKAPPEHGSWQFVWQLLWDAAPGDPELDQLARQWLQKAPPEHGSWKFAWQLLWDVAPGDLELDQLARQWLQKAPPEHGSWQFVWKPLWGAAPGDPELDQLARQWLQKAPPEHGSWQFVWQPLWDAAPGDPELDQLARQWLQRVPSEHGSWAFTWGALHEVTPEDSELKALARQWLQEVSPEHESWSFVWEKLWSTEPSPELERLARRWLRTASSEHDSWHFIWQPLRDSFPTDPELEELAKHWLQNAPPQHRSWQYVWRSLWLAAPKDSGLEQLARHWLQTAPPEHGSWRFAWEALWSATPEDPELNRLAREWLLRAPREHPSWVFIWGVLHEVTPDDRELNQLAVRWLREARTEHPSWVFIWSALYKIGSSDSELDQLARQWLQEAPPKHKSWSQAWETLWKENPCDAQLVQLGRDWLRQTPVGDKAWAFVWKPLLSIASQDEELTLPTREWLRTAEPAHGAWPHIWQPLWQLAPGDEELMGLARDWLRRASPERDSWGIIWEDLWQIVPGDVELVALARQWLRSAPPENRSWARVWLALFAGYSADSELTELARNWLRRANGHESWSDVWASLWQARQGIVELVHLAKARLQNAPQRQDRSGAMDGLIF